MKEEGGDTHMKASGAGFIPTGRRFESKIFGEAISLTRQEAGRVPQLSFADSLVQAEANAAEKLRAGTWNPGSPPTMTGLELQQAVQKALHLRPPLNVELVNALGTPIDIHWGVDGYFKLAHTEIVVTVDVTANYEKVRSGQVKADFFLTPADLSSKADLNAFAHKVANLLRKRYNEWEHQDK